MKLHKNKNQKKGAQHARRKFRTNTVAKAQVHDARVLVSRSLLYISAQVITADGAVVASISDKGMKGDTKTDRAFEAGKALANEVAKLSLGKIIFDRNGYRYHGRVKALADGLREGGIAL